MANEFVLAEVVRAWVHEELPGDAEAAERAAAIAQVAYADGASVSEACRKARGFLASWAHHPAHSTHHPAHIRGEGEVVVVRLAS